MKKAQTIVLGLIILLFSNSCTTTVRPSHTKTLIIKRAPQYKKVVYVKGRKYYTWGGKYYKKTKRGYVFISF
ncbi:hypothetical protein EGM88_08675 [Aureibaculum marinum]|uniref:SH3 domain-containing protein n=1 Tax=Aureibaculum marinum TaxID=2487930 RepID=A0A3N4PAA3_9FLAO|nr:hypothetical protein [Aureibaculum marinum]RPD96433.1 hypothetical protein EGM88_08675 [Aureibaculum marinum]